MISLKTIRISFFLSRNPHSLFPFDHRNGLPKLKHSLVCHSKSSDDSPDRSSSPPPEGDTRKQEILFRIAMLQTEKVRLSDYLDERSDYLIKFAEEANTEIDKIGEEALKQLDVASNSLMEELDSRMQAFEESAELSRVEMEENESKLLELEEQINKDRNEGLFFQGMGNNKASVENDKLAMEEMKKIQQVTKASLGSKTRRNIYLALVGLSAIAIADSFVSSPPDWKKVAVLGAILVGLLTQLSYEQGVSSETTDTTTTPTGSRKYDNDKKKK